MCVTSNILTGSVKNIYEHPIKRAFDAGLNISINTDDPVLFGITPKTEYNLVKKTFLFSNEEIEIIKKNSTASSFKRN